MAVTAFKAARHFANSFSRGSRMASSAYQSNLDPQPFTPGSDSPGAVVAKFAQVFLTEGARRRRAAIEDAVAQQQMEHAALVDADLRRKADPNYMTPYQRESLDLQKRAQTRLENPPPKEPTPVAPIKLGPDGKPDPNDPRVFNQNRLDERARLARNAVDARVRERAAAKGKESSDLANARLGLQQLEAERKHFADQQEDQARQWYRLKAGSVRTRKGEQQQATLDTLGIFGVKAKDVLPSDFRSGEDAYAKQQRQKAEAAYDAQPSVQRRRAAYMAVVNRPIPLDAEGQDDWEQTMLKVFGEPAASDGGADQ